MNTLQKFFIALTTALTAMLFNVCALAHPGHDHSAPTSMLSHVMYYGSVVVAIAVIAFAAYQVVKKNSK